MMVIGGYYEAYECSGESLMFYIELDVVDWRESKGTTESDWSRLHVGVVYLGPK